MKKVTLRRLNKQVLLESTDQHGMHILTEGSAKVGGMQAGSLPTNLLLTALGGCTAIDVISILAKMKQPLEDISIEVEGEQQEEFPQIFTKIHVHYTFTGDLKKEKVEHAIDLSKNKYCTISKMIDSVADITTSYKIVSSDKEDEE